MVLFVSFLLTFFFTTQPGLHAKSTAVQQTHKSSLWSIQTQSNKFYLLGSLHLLKQDAYPLAVAIGSAYADSRKIVFETDIAALQEPAMQAKMLQLGLYPEGQNLVFETDIAALQEPAMQAKMLQLALYPEGQNLLQNLDGRTRQLLEKKMNALGLPLEQFARFKPWFLALTLTTLELQRMGFNPNYGLDVHFFNKARTDAKEIGFLEPAEFQLNLLGEMVKKDQIAFLNQTLKDLEVVNELAADLVKFWKTGNTNELHELLYRSFKDYPAIHDRLLIQRNKKWVAEIEALMRENKNVLFVVGAGHLVGPQSVVDLLEKRGYKVKQQ
jgi:uncharacterized protein YbaP (TraB family)